MDRHRYTDSVFINCPFDKIYRPMFRAVVFAIFDCGYVARCTEENDDTGVTRIEKIVQIIAESKFGIHDISRIELDRNTRLPRFNMPLELGMFLGAKRFGDKQQKTKVCLILDRHRYRYQCFISDIAGQDIHYHSADQDKAITIVRNWLRASSRRKTIPGGSEICRRYAEFLNDLPNICQDMKIGEDEMTFNDYANLVSEWLRNGFLTT